MAALTLREILSFDVLDEAAAEVLAGQEQLDRAVRWVHSSEIYEIGPLLSGGELLLTTGLGLAGVDAGARRHYIRELAERGVAAVAIEVGRSLPEMPYELVDESKRRDLPLVVLRRVVPFIRIAETANTAIVAQSLAGRPTGLPGHERGSAEEARRVALLGDLLNGTALGRSEVVARASAVGFRPERAHHLVGVAAQAPDPAVALAALDRMARHSGTPILRAPSSGVVLGLISVSAGCGGDPVRWAQREVSGALGASDTSAITVALGHAVPAQAAWTRWGDSLRDARATLRLALGVPPPGPLVLPLVTSSRALALERELVGDGLTPESHDRLARLVANTLGPLLEWEANHPSDLVRTLEIHLRNGCSPTRTAALLHIGRQSLYQRLERIESLLGGPVSDPESHAGLLLATCARRVLRAIG